MNRAKTFIADRPGYGGIAVRDRSSARNMAAGVIDPAGISHLSISPSGIGPSSIGQSRCGLPLETGNPSGTNAHPGF